MPSEKDPRLARAGVEGFNKPKRTPDHPKKSHIVVAKEGDKVGSFTLVRTDLVGKNKIWVCKCVCGEEKVFWKYSSILKQDTCGCGIDSVGYTAKQRRSVNSRLQGYKSGAAKRGLVWELTYEDFVRISTADCFYCGVKPKSWDCMTNSPSLQKDSPNVNPEDYVITFNGIDRFDSEGGYTLDNCVPCCTYCNRAKSDLSFTDFKRHIKRVYECLYPQE